MQKNLIGPDDFSFLFLFYASNYFCNPLCYIFDSVLRKFEPFHKADLATVICS